MFVIQRVLELEGRLTLLDQSRVIEPHPSFRLFATANTIGLGDATGLYHGTQPLNQGQMDRWNIVVTLNYLAHDREVEVVLARCPEYRTAEGRARASAMVALANLTRRGFADGDLSTVMSPRTVVTWAQNTTLFHDVGARVQAHVPESVRRGRTGARGRVLPALHGRRSRRRSARLRASDNGCRGLSLNARCLRSAPARGRSAAPRQAARWNVHRPQRLSGLRAIGDRLAIRERHHDPRVHHTHRPADAPASTIFDLVELGSARCDWGPTGSPASRRTSWRTPVPKTTASAGSPSNVSADERRRLKRRSWSRRYGQRCRRDSSTDLTCSSEPPRRSLAHSLRRSRRGAVRLAPQSRAHCSRRIEKGQLPLPTREVLRQLPRRGDPGATSAPLRDEKRERRTGRRRHHAWQRRHHWPRHERRLPCLHHRLRPRRQCRFPCQPRRTRDTAIAARGRVRVHSHRSSLASPSG